MKKNDPFIINSIKNPEKHSESHGFFLEPIGFTSVTTKELRRRDRKRIKKMILQEQTAEIPNQQPTEIPQQEPPPTTE